jgi:hypothetical protein
MNDSEVCRVADAVAAKLLLAETEPLSSLLRRDVALFLGLQPFGVVTMAERHGKHVPRNLLIAFDCLRGELAQRASTKPLALTSEGDYEVDFHIRRLQYVPSEKTKRNRRLEYFRRHYEDEGSFFSDAAVKDRSPLLHWRFIGKFEHGRERGAAKTFSASLVEMCERADDEQRIREAYQSEGDMSIGEGFHTRRVDV